MIILLIFAMLFSDSVVEIQNEAGQIYEAGNAKVAEIWNIIHDAYAETETRTGFTRRKITVVYPIGDMARYKNQAMWGALVFNERIWLPSGFKRKSLLHEYGHAVLVGLYEYRWDYMPPHGWYSYHMVDSITDPGFAWIEGWAEFYQCWVDDNAFNLRPYSDRDVPNIEENNWTTNISPPPVEGAIAAGLWDMADTADSIDHTPGVDDDMWDGLDLVVWRIVRDIRPLNMNEFILEFAARDYPVFVFKHRWVVFGRMKMAYR